jgi:hypothetical protein
LALQTPLTIAFSGGQVYIIEGQKVHNGNTGFNDIAVALLRALRAGDRSYQTKLGFARGHAARLRRLNTGLLEGIRCLSVLLHSK